MNMIFNSLIAAVAALALGNPQITPAVEKAAPQQVEEVAKAEIEWLSFEEAVERMKDEPRKIMIDVYTDWCGWCKRMDATTMKDDSVIDEINRNWYAVKLDGEHKGDIIFRDRTYKFVAQGRRGYHELPAELMNGRMSYPTLVFLTEEYEIIQPLPGYRQANELSMILEYFGDNHYENTDWATFAAGKQAGN